MRTLLLGVCFCAIIVTGCHGPRDVSSRGPDPAGATSEVPPPPASTARHDPSASSAPLVGSRWELRKGESYFRIDGKPALVVGRNIQGRSEQDFAPIFEAAAAEGDRIARVHLTLGIRSHAAAGEVDEEWATRWDHVFDLADRSGIALIPVFAVHGEWNDGAQNSFRHLFDKNPYNAALGGPARSPRELFESSECQKRWLAWLGKLVARWQPRRNVAAWEVFSELDLTTGVTPESATEFTERAARVIHAGDTQHRPVTVSLSGIHDWPALFGSPEVDLVQLHPYSALVPRYAGNLDDEILDVVRSRLERYRKPVLLGEGDVYSKPTPPTSILRPERALFGARQAVWAAAVSGAVAARMLWFSDGYDSDLGNAPGYRDLAAPVVRFVQGADVAGMRPLTVKLSAGLHGAVIGSPRSVLGWFRDAASAAPDWPARRVEGQSVSFASPDARRTWKVAFIDTLTGAVTSEKTLPAQGTCDIALAPFDQAIAFRMEASP